MGVSGLISSLGSTGGPAFNVDTPDMTSIYHPPAQNWYTALPYGFEFVPRGKTAKSGGLRFYLPINPSNITVTTHFATNIITTLYSTIEEHSENRYYDIQIDGTTGFAPQNVNTVFSPNGPEQTTGRTAFDATPAIASDALGGFFSKTIGIANQIANSAQEFKNVFTGQSNPTGIPDINATGYMAFHNFYRFLLYYKKDASGVTGSGDFKAAPLTFLNYKDGLKYNCTIQRFILRRSADSPMLYNYSITLRAYNLKPLTQLSDEDDLQDKLSQLGLGGVKSSSAFNKMKSASSAAKGVLGGLTGGISVLGA